MGALLFSIFGLLIAAVLILLGMKRVLIPDVQRRCSKCEYLLIGIDSERCPECGTPTSSAVWGRLRRRWGLIVPGALIALISIHGIAGNWDRPFHTDTWYHLAPTRVLFWQKRFAQSRFSCWQELERRLVKGQLGAKQQARVYESALRQVRAAQLKKSGYHYIPITAMTQCLLQLAADGKLDAHRANKACDAGVLLLQLTAFCQVRNTPGVVARSEFDVAQAAQATMWISVKISYRLDNKPTSSCDPVFNTIPPVSFVDADPLKATPAPGRHTLRADYTIDFYRGPKGDMAHSRRIGHCTRTATTQFVVPAPSGK